MSLLVDLAPGRPLPLTLGGSAVTVQKYLKLAGSSGVDTSKWTLQQCALTVSREFAHEHLLASVTSLLGSQCLP